MGHAEASIGSLVGTPNILSHARVSDAPPNVNQPIPVPSMYQDERDEIQNLKIGAQRLNILYTKPGVMRSGDLHVDSSKISSFPEKSESGL
jgi:hypothetical protein